MPPVPALIISREEWPDADFDLPDGEPIALNTHSDKDDADDDWDIEMDLGKTGGVKAQAVVAGLAARSDFSSGLINIRPPIRPLDNEDDDDEGVSTIKAAGLPTIKAKPVVEPIEEDFEDGFALAPDLTQLSLAPLSLSHRASKNLLEWNDKDNSSSSQSSDAYSTLGFADPTSSSNSASSASSASQAETETEEEDDDLDGLVIPSGLFESGQSVNQLKKILDTKKKVLYSSASSKPTRKDPEEDFEMGLIINDDVDLSPSRLVYNAQHQSQRNFNRSNSMPPQRPSTLRPPSRAKLERSKSPTHPPTSSAKQLQKLRLSPSPPLHPPSSTQNFQSLISNFPTPSPSPSSSFLTPKPGSLRGQKSHSGLKPPTPPSSARKMTRKASMSSLMDPTHGQAITAPSPPPDSKLPRYEESTAASRAKSHKSSMGRMQDFKVPPTRPCTPSANPAALRLTMPTQSRLKSRPALSQVFCTATSSGKESPIPRPTSPLPPRPPSSSSLRASLTPVSRTNTQHPPPVPKLLRKPKRARTYGDGTELDAFEDLPTDRDKEIRYRVQPKGYGNRVPGGTYGTKATEKLALDASQEKDKERGTIRRKGKISLSNEPATHAPPQTLRRKTTRIELGLKSPTPTDSPPKKKPTSCNSPSSSTSTRRKPTLIRNLGGVGGPKVVGEMKWNPQTLRWEGNDQALRDFDVAVGTSTRPALITHLSGSAHGSPAGSLASGARVVGNMMFDPTRMCWMSTLAPEDDEPDVFANLADDEQEDWDSKGGTIRASVPRISDVSSTSSSSRTGAISPAGGHSRSISDSGSDRGSRASMLVGDIDDAFVQACRQAEDRHRSDMKGWRTALSRKDPSLASDRTFLFEIRALATRKY